MLVTFVHPRDSALTFQADVEPHITGKQALEGLYQGDADGPFITKPPQGEYELILARTGVQITPTMSFSSAQIQDGDIIHVRLASSGAA